MCFLNFYIISMIFSNFNRFQWIPIEILLPGNRFSSQTDRFRSQNSSIYDGRWIHISAKAAKNLVFCGFCWYVDQPPVENATVLGSKSVRLGRQSISRKQNFNWNSMESIKIAENRQNVRKLQKNKKKQICIKIPKLRKKPKNLRSQVKSVLHFRYLLTLRPSETQLFIGKRTDV